MSPGMAHQRLEDFEDFENDWEVEEQIQPIRRRDRPTSEADQRQDGKRKRDRRREAPIHKREES
jgi:hypothetical protein